MNPAQRNNNPINLRFAGQTEATGADPAGFAIFPDPSAGWRAAHAQIDLDQQRGLSLKEFIWKFAPPNENDSRAYLDFVTSQFGVADEAKLIRLSKYAIAGVMACREGYYAK